MGLHDLAEERSLAYHRLVAERLTSEAGLIVRARQRAQEWAASGEPHAPYAREWVCVLDLPVDRLVTVLCDPSERGRALRRTGSYLAALRAASRASTSAASSVPCRDANCSSMELAFTSAMPRASASWRRTLSS